MRKNLIIVITLNIAVVVTVYLVVRIISFRVFGSLSKLKWNYTSKLWAVLSSSVTVERLCCAGRQSRRFEKFMGVSSPFDVFTSCRSFYTLTRNAIVFVVERSRRAWFGIILNSEENALFYTTNYNWFLLTIFHLTQQPGDAFYYSDIHFLKKEKSSVNHDPYSWQTYQFFCLIPPLC